MSREEVLEALRRESLEVLAELSAKDAQRIIAYVQRLGLDFDVADLGTANTR